MGRIEFDKLPITTLMGARWKVFRGTTKGRHIDKGYRGKYMLSIAIARVLTILMPIENMLYNKKLRNKAIERDPVFILGHWRSGTTFVHTILSQDKQFGYNTTYQTVFPNLMLFGQNFFKRTMSSIMPDKRPTDNMELKVDLPQEEEFALANMTTCSYYNFWFLPKHTMEYCHKFLTFKEATQEQKKEFKDTFLRLIKISLWNTNGKRFLSKNPPHTARVKEILEMFPNAKFVYLMRNPYTVFESTKSFFTNVIAPLKLQDIPQQEIDRNIIDVYKIMYDKYNEDKHLIPEGNLIEIKFEDFEAAPYQMTEKIYETLSIEGFDKAKEKIEKYLNKKKGYKKNQYSYEASTKEIVEKNWGFAVKDWGYKSL